MNSTTNILSLNVNGLRGSERRRNIFSWLKDSEADVFLLQDVRCDDEVDKLNWSREWGGATEWRGKVGILIRKGKGELQDTSGWGDRLLWGVWARPGWGPVVVGSYYCPAERGARITWIEDLLDSGSLVEAGVDVLGGDFNMVRDVAVDRSDGGLDGIGRSGGLDR